ncbi:hypothetical protein TNCV_4289531 [Trichonephila clavipes]|nr:hypothetical protein TNCV_4289531 [Trichonephila clavipes]
MTPELAPPLQATTQSQWEDFEPDRFNVHQPPLHSMSSVATRLEPATCWLRVHDHNYSCPKLQRCCVCRIVSKTNFLLMSHICPKVFISGDPGD